MGSFSAQYNTYVVICTLILTAGCSYQDCVVPAWPEHSLVSAYEADCPTGGSQTPACRSVPGTQVQDGWFLFVTCREGFVLDTQETGPYQSTCADGRWLPSLPACTYNFTNDKYKCVAPPYPKNGKYTPLPIECALSNRSSAEHLRPGTYLPESCVLLYSCQDGYQVDEQDVISVCENNRWIPDKVTCQVSTSLINTKATGSSGSSSCTLPPAENRRFCSFECQDCQNQLYRKCAFAPSSPATEPVIKVQCEQGYRLKDNQPSAAIVCVNGNWTTEFPECLKVCPPLESDSLYVTCMYGTSQVDCSKPMLPSSTATYQCRPSYSEYPNLSQVYRRTLTCRNTGKWSNVLFECEPVCGVSKGGVKVEPTIIDGKDTPLGAFPWHAGLYRGQGHTWECICGGSLITNKIILTAAHCVAQFEASELRVALGKYYRSWDKNEEYMVKRNVTAIKVPREYNGGPTYTFDIALLLLDKKVQFNSLVMPVCRDVNLPLTLQPNAVGFVVGWGKTMENGKESEVLLHNDLTVLDHSECFRRLPKILSYDKLCGIKGSVSVAEKGDSGGGVTIIANDLHYIIGIVSIKITNLSLFTNVSWPTHRLWLENMINSFDTDVSPMEQ